MPRTPPVRIAAPKVRVEPQGRRLRPAASTTVLHPTPEAPPHRREWLGRPFATIASLLLRQHRLGRVTVEARWHPHGFAAGSTATRAGPGLPVDANEATVDAAAIDRHWAVATMIVAACLAVAVSVIVAPRLRSATQPAYPEDSALVQQGAAVYSASCAACHGADLKGGATAQGLGPPPLDASGHAWLHADATLFRMVKFGVANCFGASSQPQMPSFAGQLDDRSIHSVLAFIKSRWPADLRVVQNAFNDGASESAETQEAVLCTAICPPPSPNATGR